MNFNLKPILNRAAGLAGGVARQGAGLARRVQHMRPGAKPGMTDETLKAKVESTVFRPAGAPKSKVDVNVVDGIVHLHGEVKNPDEIKKLVGRVEAIPEVKGVQNALHLPKTKAPTTAAKRSTAKKPAKPRTTQRFNREVKTTGEPAPKDLAAAGSGRKPAPLGAKEAAEATPPATAGTPAGTPAEKGEKGEKAVDKQSESPAASKTGTGSKSA